MQRGFTLLELSLAIFLAMLVVTMAVPALSGVLAGQEEEEEFVAFDELVQQVRQRSVEERKPWVLEWRKGEVVARPWEGSETAQTLPIPESESLTVTFPAALVEQPAPLWLFWPAGNCEAAVITYSDGKKGWSARYHPLTARAEVVYHR